MALLMGEFGKHIQACYICVPSEDSNEFQLDSRRGVVDERLKCFPKAGLRLEKVPAFFDSVTSNFGVRIAQQPLQRGRRERFEVGQDVHAMKANKWVHAFTDQST